MDSNNEYNSDSIPCTSSYADSYADPYADPYVDPYSDSYADPSQHSKTTPTAIQLHCFDDLNESSPEIEIDDNDQLKIFEAAPKILCTINELENINESAPEVKIYGANRTSDNEFGDENSDDIDTQ
ncbi:35950_t:CDS:2, partial [Gigaspora margarita]